MFNTIYRHGLNKDIRHRPINLIYSLIGYGLKYNILVRDHGTKMYVNSVLLISNN